MKQLLFMLFMSMQTHALSLSLHTAAAQRIINQNPYKNQIAHVRQSNDLCAGERAFLRKRKPKVKKALEKLLGRSLRGKSIPTIAFCFSGGGALASVCSLGFLLGAEKTGLLDAVTYISALSSSTFMLSAWMERPFSLQNFVPYLLSKMAIGFYKKIGFEECSLLMDSWRVKQLCGQTLSAIDLFGGLAAHAWFDHRGDQRHQVRLSQQATLVESGCVPCPIYTMVSGEKDREHIWYECTPWEIGSSDLQAYVPTWAFGRRFEHGVSLDDAPEQSMGYLLGLFNSVWAATLQETYDHAFFELLPDYKTRGMREMWRDMMTTRLIAPELPNFMVGLPQCFMCEQKNLQFVDAGIAFDMPYPPVSGARAQRAPDIIIFCNVSVPVKELSRLDRARDYAYERGLPFPVVNMQGIHDRIISVYRCPYGKGPTLIYMPRIYDAPLWQQQRWRAEFAEYGAVLDNFDLYSLTVVNTTCVSPKNFCIAEKDARPLVAMTDFNMQMAMSEIINVINEVVDRKNR